MIASLCHVGKKLERRVADVQWHRLDEEARAAKVSDARRPVLVVAKVGNFPLQVSEALHEPLDRLRPDAETPHRTSSSGPVDVVSLR